MSNRNVPFVYVALCGTEFVEADDDLHDLLEVVRQLHVGTHEDVVLWRHGTRIAAIVHHDGSETIFEPLN